MDVEPTAPARGGAAIFEGVLSLMVHGSRIKIWMKGSSIWTRSMTYSYHMQVRIKMR